MKTILKVVLWFLIIGTLGLVALILTSAMVDTAEKPLFVQKLLNFDFWLNVFFFWGYALFAIALIASVVAFVFNIISNPSSLVKTVIGLVIVIAVAGLPAIWVHYHAPQPVPNSAGGFFENPLELKIAEAGLYVTYIVASIAGLALLYTIVSGIVRKIIK